MPGYVTRCFRKAGARLKPLVLEQLRLWARGTDPRRIVIKPNWVLHATDPAFPIGALVTDPRVIEAVVEACLELFPRAESILIGDCPLQSADWPLLCEQSGLKPLIARLEAAGHGRVCFRDLRREVFHFQADGFLAAAESDHGDPRGYRDVELGARSHLEPISDQAGRFGVNDYSAAVTRSNHRAGSHRYLVAQSVLDADLFINLPKWKCHSKTALTGALKNLVGINGDKACLPHFRRGAPRWGGDEYGDDGRWLYWAQTNLRSLVQKRSRVAYKALKPGWKVLKRLCGLQTRMTNPADPPRRFYSAGGAWPGNQTLWRTIYDLNLVIQCADAQGRLQLSSPRRCLTILDGLIGGEGNGPLQPLPRQIDCLLFGEDPFAMDAALAWFMGFDPGRIPIISQRRCYEGPDWGDFEFDSLMVELDGVPVRVSEAPVNFRFAPPPGWRNYIER